MAIRDEIEQRYQQNALTTTKEGEVFRVLGVRANAVYVDIPSGDWPIRISIR